MVTPTTESGRGIILDSRMFDIVSVCVRVELLELTQEGVRSTRGYNTYGPVPVRLGFIVAALFDERVRKELDLSPVLREKKLMKRIYRQRLRNETNRRQRSETNDGIQVHTCVYIMSTISSMNRVGPTREPRHKRQTRVGRMLVTI